MKENILHIPYTEDLLLSLKKSREQFEQDARFFLAAKLYELEKNLFRKSGQAGRIGSCFLSSQNRAIRDFTVSDEHG